MRAPLIIATLLLAGCPASEDGGVVWSQAYDASADGAVSGVWGASGEAVYAVGGTPQQATVRRFDGSSWTKMDVPQIPLLVWAYGFGPNDVYAVGESGAMAHYDGTSWTPIDTGTSEDLWGIFGFSDSELWIVGGAVDRGDPVLMKYDGTNFTSVEVRGDLNPTGARALFKVWGIGSTLFAVGGRGLILQYDGSDWSRVSAGAEAADDFVALWGTAENNILAVGGRAAAQVAHWDGSTWTSKRDSGIPGLSAVWMGADDHAVVGGSQGWAGTLSTDLTLSEEAANASLDLHAAWGDGSGRTWVVGGRFAEPYEGEAVVREEE